MLIPENYLDYEQWVTVREQVLNGYLNSYINKTILTNEANNLKKILGTHLILRNVLLSNNATWDNGSTSYAWTTAYCTLPSVGQLIGEFASHHTKYDDGEANYKLPLFNFTNINNGYGYWTRNIEGYNYQIYDVSYNGTVGEGPTGVSKGMTRVLIYIR